MAYLKQLLAYAIMIGLLVAAAMTITHFTSRAQVSSDYTEIEVPNVDHYPSYAMAAVSIGELHHGDVVCYRVPHDNDTGNGNAFAWVAALPGERVALVHGVVQVNGQPAQHGSVIANRPDQGPVMVPADHVFVITSTHSTDSIARGPLPTSVLQGRVEGFP